MSGANLYRYHVAETTTLDNSAFKLGLSAKALGLWCLVQSLPDDYYLSIAALCGMVADGRASVRSGLEELEGRGMLLRGRRIGSDARGRLRSENVWVTIDDPSLLAGAIEDMVELGVSVIDSPVAAALDPADVRKPDDGGKPSDVPNSHDGPAGHAARKPTDVRKPHVGCDDAQPSDARKPDVGCDLRERACVPSQSRARKDLEDLEEREELEGLETLRPCVGSADGDPELERVWKRLMDPQLTKKRADLARARGPYAALVADGIEPQEILSAWRRRTAGARRIHPNLRYWLEDGGCKGARAMVMAARAVGGARPAAVADPDWQSAMEPDDPERDELVRREQCAAAAYAVARGPLGEPPQGCGETTAAEWRSRVAALKAEWDAAISERERYDAQHAEGSRR